MPIPILHLATAFISPASHAWSNTIDNLFSTRLKGNTTFLVCMSKIFQFLLMLPLAFFLHPSLDVPLYLVLLMGIVAIIEFAYIYPYFWAMAHTDTSIVVALFSFGKITIPVIAWFFLGEKLHAGQYAGFGLIILAGLMLTFNWRRFHLNKAAGFMLLSSFLLSIEAILTKYVMMQGIRWDSVTVFTMVLEGMIAGGILALRPRNTIALWQKAGPSTQKLFILEAFLSMVGNAGGMLALSLMPTSIAKAISSIQHLFVAFYAKVFHPLAPRYFKENSTELHPLLKLLGLLLTVIGTILAAGYSFLI